ncbi:MAG: hypothetical protein ACT4PU_08630 [Planctomycetota bacterium]
MSEPDLLHEALTYLTGEGRAHPPAELLERLYGRFRSAGRDRLADLVYEMAKACLAALPDVSVRTLLQVEPRRPDVISGELTTLSQCLASVSAAADVTVAAGRRPAPPEALEDARKCLSVLATLEGGTGRQQLGLALLEVHAGQPAVAERVLRGLLARTGEAPEILRIAQVNLAFALVRQRRFAEALPAAQEAASAAPDDPVPLFNLLAAAAELRDREAFELGVARLREIHSRGQAPLVAKWVAHDLQFLGAIAGLSPARIDELARLGS